MEGMTSKSSRQLILAVIFCLAAQPAAAEIERIEDFHSEIRVERDGSLTVTETIAVITDGRAERGFTRRIESDFTNELGRGQRQSSWWRPVYKIEVFGAWRDGVEDTWATEQNRRGVLIDVGRGPTVPAPGPHEYVLKYRVKNQVAMFAGQDQLTWDVTGGEWPAPVEQARATVVLPGDAKPLRFADETEKSEEDSSEYQTRVDSEGAAVFSATRPLAPGERMTVAVSWAKGFVREGADKYAYDPPPGGRINNFHSDIRIMLDGTLEVTETFELTTDGKRFKNGFVRYFPESIEHRDGTTFGLRLNILNAWKNGRAVKWSVDDSKVKLGYYRQTGTDTFSLQYTTNRQVRFGGEYDQLVWDAMYYAWAMPVDKASVTVMMPGGADMQSMRAHARGDDDDGASFEAEKISEGLVDLRTVRPLVAREGMVVTVSWPRGFVERPPIRYDDDGEPIENPMWTFRGNPPLKTGVWAFGLLGVFYMGVWLLRGRDPDPGDRNAAAASEPPTGLCPAAVRFVINMAADHRTLAAGIVSLAARGRLVVRRVGFGGFTLTKTGGAEGLPESEANLVDALFPEDATDLEISPASRERMESAESRLLLALNAGHAGKSFVANSDFLALGIVATLGIVVVMVGQSPGGGYGIFLVAFGLAIAYAAYRQAKKIFAGLSRPKSGPPEGRILSFLFRYRGNSVQIQGQFVLFGVDRVDEL